jgi:hypothetical protein
MQASAASTSFTQQILPLDCVFEVVNDGTQTIKYITPAQCGQIVPPPETTGGTTTPDVTPNAQPAQSNGYYYLPPTPTGASTSNLTAGSTIDFSQLQSSDKPVVQASTTKVQTLGSLVHINGKTLAVTAGGIVGVLVVGALVAVVF